MQEDRIEIIDNYTGDDYRTITRLLRDARYEIPERLRGKVIGGIEKIIDADTGETTTERGNKLVTSSNSGVTVQDQIAAMRVLCELDNLNVKLVSLAIPKKSQVEVKRISDMTTEELEGQIKKYLENKHVSPKSVG